MDSINSSELKIYCDDTKETLLCGNAVHTMQVFNV